jgi:DNA-binding beta-propeller fold protein YncE
VRRIALTCLTIAIAAGVSCASSDAGRSSVAQADPYAAYVWPPPPDPPRIRLVDILSQRLDVEAESRMSKILIGASPRGAYDRLQRPMGVALDRKGRVLVSDMKLGAILRFDREGRILDVFGTTGSSRLRAPISVEVTRENTILIADVGLKRIVELDAEGSFLRALGRAGDLDNPTDAVLSRDGRAVYVCDSKRHQIVVFDRATGEVVDRFGRRGEKPGEFNYPTAIAFAADGSLFVVDQINARVQILSPDGEYLETLGSRGTRYGQFVRPKDVAIDSMGYIYVTDGAFNNVQIFNQDLELLTFVGRSGSGPGEFQVAGGVAADERGFAIVDQLGKRVQVFGYLQARRGTGGENGVK